MTIPLIVLAAGALLAGLIGVPEIMVHGLPESVEHVLTFFNSWLVPSVLPASPEPHEHAVEWGLMAAATLISLGGIGLAAALYRGNPSPTREQRAEFLRRLTFWEWRPDEAAQAWAWILRVTECD